MEIITPLGGLTVIGREEREGGAVDVVRSSVKQGRVTGIEGDRASRRRVDGKYKTQSSGCVEESVWRSELWRGERRFSGQLFGVGPVVSCSEWVQ